MRVAATTAMRVLRVALVDDHADIRRLIGVLVAAAGHQVVGEAADGREVIRRNINVCAVSKWTIGDSGDSIG